MQQIALAADRARLVADLETTRVETRNRATAHRAAVLGVARPALTARRGDRRRLEPLGVRRDDAGSGPARAPGLDPQRRRAAGSLHPEPARHDAAGLGQDEAAARLGGYRGGAVAPRSLRLRKPYPALQVETRLAPELPLLYVHPRVDRAGPVQHPGERGQGVAAGGRPVVATGGASREQVGGRRSSIAGPASPKRSGGGSSTCSTACAAAIAARRGTGLGLTIVRGHDRRPPGARWRRYAGPGRRRHHDSCHAAARRRLPPARSRATNDGQPGQRRAARILVVDDESQIRKFLEISLRSQGYEVAEIGHRAGRARAARHPRRRPGGARSGPARPRRSGGAARAAGVVEGAGDRALGARLRAGEGARARRRRQRLRDQAVRHPGADGARARAAARAGRRRGVATGLRRRPPADRPGAAGRHGGRRAGAPHAQGVRGAGAAGAQRRPCRHPAAAPARAVGPGSRRGHALPAHRRRQDPP